MTEQEKQQARFYELLETAEQDPEGQYQIGLCYQQGLGVEKDAEQAKAYFRLAAQAGHEEALKMLSGAPSKNEHEITFKNLASWCLRADEGDSDAQYEVAHFLAQKLPRCKAESQKWLTAAAGSGNGQACFELGRRLYHENPAEAVQFFTRAADSGLPRAMEQMGICCSQGYGVPKDPQQAENWFIRAAERGDAGDKVRLWLRYKEGIDVPASVTKAGSWKNKAQQAGFVFNEENNDMKMLEYDFDPDLLRTKAEAGDAAAQYQLAGCYKIGNGMNQSKQKADLWCRKAAENGNMSALQEMISRYASDSKKAFVWYQKAAELGDVKAQCEVARRYDKGISMDVNPKEAFVWYQKAAEQGNVEAQYEVAQRYDRGIGVGVDQQKAFEWYKKAAEKGNSEAQYEVAKRCKKELGMVEQTFLWYQKAAQAGIAQAQYEVYQCYAEGKAVKKDMSQAFTWCRKAAKNGVAEAQYELAVFYNEGKCVGKSDAQAYKWYKKAAEKGVDKAYYELAECFAKGKGTGIHEKEAFEWYKKSAESGCLQAQCVLAQCYGRGLGVQKSAQTAFFWYQKAAMKDHAEAQYELGKCYAEGKGTNKNPAQAMEWYQKAAEQGNEDAKLCLSGMKKKQELKQKVAQLHSAAQQGDAEAQYQLARCYELGRGTIQNTAQAMEWYQKAAEQSHLKALCELGRHYDSGEGVAQNHEQAMQWYQKAVDQGCEDVQPRLQQLKTQKAQQERIARMKEDAANGDAEAQYQLARHYAQSKKNVQNAAQAMEWYQRAAEQGHSEAQWELGQRYEIGEGVAKNHEQAMQWYKKAAEQGHLKAQCELGRRYDIGEGVAKNQEQAMQWYQKAAEQGCKEVQPRLQQLKTQKAQQEKIARMKENAANGDADAQYQLAQCYAFGRELAKNTKQAAEWYEKSAQNGNANAQFALAQCFENGTGVIKNQEQALSWYQKAAEQDHKNAQKRLQELRQMKEQQQANTAKVSQNKSVPMQPKAEKQPIYNTAPIQSNDQENKEQADKKEWSKKNTVLLILILVLLMLVKGFMAVRPVKLKWENYVDVAFSGVDSRGVAEVQIDWKKMRNSLPSGRQNAVGSVWVEVSKDEFLSNGEEITVHLKYDPESFKENRVTVKNDSFTVQVKGLEKASVVDAFKDIDVSFEGISGFGKAVVTNNSSDEFVKQMNFSVEKNWDLSNGDKIKVSVWYDENEADRRQIAVPEIEREYEVQGLDTYVASMTELNEEAIAAIDAQCRDYIKTHVESSPSVYYNEVHNTSGWDRNFPVFQSIEPEVSYICSRKQIEYEYNTNNFIVRVYKLTATDDVAPEGVTFYYSVAYPTLIKSADGTITIDLQNPLNQCIKLGLDLDTVYISAVAPHAEKFNIDQG